MSLKETEREIYKRDSDPSGSDRQKEPGRRIADEEPFAASSFEAENLGQRKDIWIKEREEKKEQRKRWAKKISVVLGSIAMLAGLVWLTLYIRKSAFSEDQVKVSISVPEKVKSGENVSLDIIYQNVNRASLSDAVLYLSYPENFKPSGNLQFETEGPNTSKINIGKIGGKSDGKITIQGKFFGARDALVYLEAKLEYKSSTFNSKFLSKGNSSVFISSTPLAIEISGPQNAAPGNAVSYTITYQNSGQESFNDLKIKVEFPEGFSFSNSEPLASDNNNIWYVGNFVAGQSGQVKISGVINGNREEEKWMKAFIGEVGADNIFISYGEAQSRLKIIGSPIVLNETINGKKENVFVNAGEMLLFEVNYKNTGSIGLRDVILTIEADSPILDYSRIESRTGKGEFDSKKNIITWKPSQISDFKMLAPNKEGKISVAIPVKSIIPVNSINDKNFSFSAVAKMDSPDIPTPEGSNKVIASNAVEVKLNSKLIASQQGFFNDADISNSGPMPPKVGQETTFTLRLKVANVSNNATDAKGVITLPPGVTWKNNFLPRDASVNFNERSNELVWNIGSLSAGTGIISDAKELVFQVGVTPAAEQAGNFAALISGTVFSAKDAFTGQALEVKLGEKNTRLSEDLGVGDSGKVAP